MQTGDATTLFWMYWCLHALGIASAWIARLSERSATQRAGQGLFLVFMCLVGLTTFWSSQFGHVYWLVSGTTFALMVLLVSCDFGYHTREASV